MSPVEVASLVSEPATVKLSHVVSAKSESPEVKVPIVALPVTATVLAEMEKDVRASILADEVTDRVAQVTSPTTSTSSSVMKVWTVIVSALMSGQLSDPSTRRSCPIVQSPETVRSPGIFMSGLAFIGAPNGVGSATFLE
jgi:hypothetical protein